MSAVILREAGEIVALFDQLQRYFSLEQAIALVEQKRNRKLIVVEKRIKNSYMGLAFSSDDSVVDPYDLVILLPGLPRRLYIESFFHEVTHVLRGVAKQISRAYDESLITDILSFDLVPKKSIGLYERNFEEDVAEAAATLLWRRVWTYEMEGPEVLRRIYGSGKDRR